MRYHMADNMMLHLSYTPMQSMMVSVKQMFGYVCLDGCVFFLLLLLCDVTAGAQHAQEDTLLELCGAYIVQRCFEPCQVGASYNETYR